MKRSIKQGYSFNIYALHFFIFSIITQSSFCQTTEKKVFLKIEPIDGYSNSGTKSIYSKGGTGAIAEAMTPRVEINAADNGFTIRTDFHMRRYDDNFNLVWETDLKKNFTLQSQPGNITRNSLNNSYFMEYAVSGDISINKVNEKGQLSQCEIKDGKGSPIIFDNEIYLFQNKAVKKEKRYSYDIAQIDYTKCATSSKEITLKTNEYEYENSNKKNTYWSVLPGQINGRSILFKKYFKDIEGSKKKELIIETAEIDSKAQVSNYFKWSFDAKFSEEDQKFMIPALAFDKVNNELYIFGYMSVNRQNLNGLYLLKYNYVSHALLYSKDYGFDDIFKSTTKNTHFSIPKSVGTVVPIGPSSSDYYLNTKDKLLTLQIITNYIGTATTYYEVKFDANGDHVQTDVVEYRTYNFNYPNGLKSLPVFHETLMKDTTRPNFVKAKATAQDYIISKSEKSKAEIYTFPINRDSYSIVIFYDEVKGEFSAVKIK